MILVKASLASVCAASTLSRGKKKKDAANQGYFKLYLLVLLLLVQQSRSRFAISDNLALGNGSGEAFPDSRVGRVLSRDEALSFQRQSANVGPGLGSGSGIWLCRTRRTSTWGLFPAPCLAPAWEWAGSVHTETAQSSSHSFPDAKKRIKKKRKILFLKQSERQGLC